MIENLRAPLMALTILLGATALIAVPGAAAARGASQEHKEHKVHKNHDEKDRARAHRKKHDKTVMCIKAPCPANGRTRTSRPAMRTRTSPPPRRSAVCVRPKATSSSRTA